MRIMNMAMLAVYFCTLSPHLSYAQTNINPVNPHQHQTIKKTLHYRIADIDPRFHLSQQQVLELTQQAAKIWEHETGQQNFIYDPEAEFSINLVFDERQQRSTDRVQSLQQLQQDQQQWHKQNQQLQQLKADIQQNSALIADKQAQLNAQFQQYNQDVQHFNQQRSSSKVLADQLAQRQTALQQQALALQQEIQRHNQRSRQLNQDLQALNQGNQQLVASANQFNQIFQPRLFHKGHFDGKHIMIYEFSSTHDLRLTLAHEFGHALGFAHTDDPSSLMYPIIQQQNLQKFALTDSDKDLVKAMY